MAPTSESPATSGRCQLHAKLSSACAAMAARSLSWQSVHAAVHAPNQQYPSTCTGGLSNVWASMRARALRNASQAEQSTPPEGTMIELFPLGLHCTRTEVAGTFPYSCSCHLCVSIRRRP